MCGFKVECQLRRCTLILQGYTCDGLVVKESLNKNCVCLIHEVYAPDKTAFAEIRFSFSSERA